MPGSDGRLETAVSLVLADAAPALAEAHRELHPLAARKQIPFHVTLLYPFIPRASLTQAHIAELRSFFAPRPRVVFDLARLAEFPGAVVYVVPEPDDKLRATMRALWAAFPDTPPYGGAFDDPQPHATLALLEGDAASIREAVAKRVDGLLPMPRVVHEASLLEEYEPDLWRVREALRLAR